MKNQFLLLTLVILLIFQSCEKDRMEETTQNSDVTTEKSVIIDGTIYEAGYGYDATQDRAYNMAFSSSISRRSDIGIKTYYDGVWVENKTVLEQFLSKNKGRNFNFDLSFINVPFSFNSNKGRDIATEVKINDEFTSYIVSIDIAKEEHFMSGYTLKPEAQNLLNEGKYTDFANTYGDAFVDRRVTGGSVYLIYVFERRQSSTMNRETFKKKTGGLLGSIFGFGTTTEVSETEKAEILNSRVSVKAYTDVDGFAPSLTIENRQQLEDLGRAFISHIDQRPETLSTSAMSVKSYGEVISNGTHRSGLNNILARRKTCMDKYATWLNRSNRLQDISSSVAYGNFRDIIDSRNVEVISEGLYNAQVCNSSASFPDSNKDLSINSSSNIYAQGFTLYPDIPFNINGWIYVLQGDGNFVIYKPNGGVEWASNTDGQGFTKLVFQSDGNLVLYNDDESKAKGLSNTYMYPNSQCFLQEDGNLVIYHGGRAVWSSRHGKL